jgi:RNA polymerase sigma-70 factor, ECF subfamily
LEEPEIRLLVAQARSGSTEAYANLVRKHQNMVLRLCASMLGPSNAEDAAQDVFLKAYKGLADFREESAFSSWLYRIAMNICLNLAKKAAVRRAESLEAIIDEKSEAGHFLEASGRDVSAELENKDFVEKALAGLKPDFRAILALREIEGHSYTEIATALGCSMDAVKARLRRAREALTEQVRHIREATDV